jgi:hypothetical protein
MWDTLLAIPTPKFPIENIFRGPGNIPGGRNRARRRGRSSGSSSPGVPRPASATVVGPWSLGSRRPGSSPPTAVGCCRRPGGSRHAAAGWRAPGAGTALHSRCAGWVIWLFGGRHQATLMHAPSSVPDLPDDCEELGYAAASARGLLARRVCEFARPMGADPERSLRCGGEQPALDRLRFRGRRVTSDCHPSDGGTEK